MFCLFIALKAGRWKFLNSCAPHAKCEASVTNCAEINVTASGANHDCPISYLSIFCQYKRKTRMDSFEIRTVVFFSQPGLLFKSTYKDAKLNLPSGKAKQQDYKYPTARARCNFRMCRARTADKAIKSRTRDWILWCYLSVSKNLWFVTSSKKPRCFMVVTGTRSHLCN